MIVNILLYHLLLDHTAAAVAIIVAILWGILVFRHRQYFSSLFAPMAGSGLRIGEVSGLETEDLNLAAGLIRVRRGIWKGRAIAPKTKRGKRTGFYRAHARADALFMSRGKNSGRVFQTTSGKPHSGHNVWRNLKLILKSLGLQPGGLQRISSRPRLHPPG